jgi:hypothetical protein
VIVTAANSAFLRPLLNLLACIRRHEAGQRAVVYDLGLSAAERAAIPAEVRRFDFARWPPHVARLLGYAWKPLVVREALAEGEPVIWMDSANLFWQPLAPIWRHLDHAGLYVPLAKRTVADSTAPQVLDALGVGPQDRIRSLPGRHAALMGVSPSRADIAQRWAAAALQEAVINPPGIPKAMHMHDQAVLQVLAYQSGAALEDSWFSVTRGNKTMTAEQAAACLDSPRPW